MKIQTIGGGGRKLLSYLGARSPSKFLAHSGVEAAPIQWQQQPLLVNNGQEAPKQDTEAEHGEGRARSVPDHAIE